jgi:hypothetical protein
MLVESIDSQRGFEPPFDIEQDPTFFGVVGNSLE